MRIWQLQTHMKSKAAVVMFLVFLQSSTIIYFINNCSKVAQENYLWDNQPYANTTTGVKLHVVLVIFTFFLMEVIHGSNSSIQNKCTLAWNLLYSFQKAYSKLKGMFSGTPLITFINIRLYLNQTKSLYLLESIINHNLKIGGINEKQICKF